MVKPLKRDGYGSVVTGGKLTLHRVSWVVPADHHVTSGKAQVLMEYEGDEHKAEVCPPDDAIDGFLAIDFNAEDD